MENASKALLIAGAILIVILLIAVGMLVYSKSKSVVDTGIGQMDATEIAMLNARFNNYEGIQRGSTVRALLQAIVANNETYTDDASKQVRVTLKIGATEAINGVSNSDDIAAQISNVGTSTSFRVSFGTTNSLITSVTITPKSD